LPPLRYHISDDGDVIEELARRPVQDRADFAELLDRLIVDPTDKRIGVLPLKDRWRAYTAPFDQAILTFSLTADHPCIRLHLVTWIWS
jgi:hypothetical protein